MHLHSIEVALQGGPVPPRFISIKWGGTSAPPEFTGGSVKCVKKKFAKLIVFLLFCSVCKMYEVPENS